MTRRVERVSVDALSELPDEVRSCVFWELSPADARRARLAGCEAEQKQDWMSRVLLDWGSCGRVVRVDGTLAGLVTYAPPVFFEGAAPLPSGPVSDDAVLLATAWVAPSLRDQGLGRMLLQSMVGDLATRSGHRAVECFGRTGAARGGGDAGAHGPAHAHDGCFLPVDVLQRVGFRTVQPHLVHPRMRLDVRAAASWREELGLAWERLRGVVSTTRPVPAPGPLSPRHAAR